MDTFSCYKDRFCSWIFFYFDPKKYFTKCRKQLLAFNFVIHTIDVHRKILFFFQLVSLLVKFNISFKKLVIQSFLAMSHLNGVPITHTFKWYTHIQPTGFVKYLCQYRRVFVEKHFPNK